MKFLIVIQILLIKETLEMYRERYGEYAYWFKGVKG